MTKAHEKGERSTVSAFSEGLWKLADMWATETMHLRIKSKQPEWLRDAKKQYFLPHCKDQISMTLVHLNNSPINWQVSWCAVAETCLAG